MKTNDFISGLAMCIGVGLGILIPALIGMFVGQMWIMVVLYIVEALVIGLYCTVNNVI